jgi:adenylate cyclase
VVPLGENAAVAEIDFAGEGLLEGVSGDAREARLELLRALADDGASVEDLRDAVREQRLALLPVERALVGELRYTIEEVAAEAGLDVDFLAKELQALGLPTPDPGEKALTESDLEAARRSRLFREVGLPDDGIFEVARVIGNSMARLAAANMGLIAEVYRKPGDTERDLGFRFAEIARTLSPVLGSTMEYVFERHLHELVRQVMLSQEEIESGQAQNAQEIAVGFADLVGFTRLGERLDVGEIGEVSGRLTELATSSAQSPVRLVKTIGDAAMMVSPSPPDLLEAIVGLVAAIEDDEVLPSAKAGAAWGLAMPRGGDWYGSPVNLASRITDTARPGSVLVTEELAEKGGEDAFRFSNAGRQHFKGISGTVKVLRARRARELPWRRP